jgi:hypothetical protein
VLVSAILVMVESFSETQPVGERGAGRARSLEAANRLASDSSWRLQATPLERTRGGLSLGGDILSR